MSESTLDNVLGEEEFFALYPKKEPKNVPSKISEVSSRLLDIEIEKLECESMDDYDYD